jgi:broad-specificity NMP kinase
MSSVLVVVSGLPGVGKSSPTGILRDPVAVFATRSRRNR